VSRARIVSFVLCMAAVASAAIVGCRKEGSEQAGAVVNVQAPQAPPQSLEEQARKAVALVTGADAADVTIVDQSASGDVLSIEATVPAAKAMVATEAEAPDTEGGAQAEQPVEWVKVRWNTADGSPEDITWPERLQFAEDEPVTQERAEEVAAGLKSRWFPEVPVPMVLQPPHQLHRPVWVVSWRGKGGDEALSGDEVVVQVSSVTGLPIAYTQRVAVQRPSPDDVKVTRKEAVEAARAALGARGVRDAADMSLVARLVLSSEEQPQGGPAWLVRDTVEGKIVVPVDAMTGEVLTGGGNG